VPEITRKRASGSLIRYILVVTGPRRPPKPSMEVHLQMIQLALGSVNAAGGRQDLFYSRDVGRMTGRAPTIAATRRDEGGAPVHAHHHAPPSKQAISRQHARHG